ncbi:MAG: HEAT repeat domain-containing protein [Planctomycetota bacterium]|jgi:HEAT repeat protein
MSIHGSCRRALLVLGLVLTMAAPAAARQGSTPADFLEEFVHYVLIARPDLAEAWAQALLQSGISDAELAELLDEVPKRRERFDQALGTAHRMPELEEIAALLDKKVFKGRLDLSRDPDRINEAIEWLVGMQRQRFLAAELLSEAGEYAVPALLNTIVEGQDERLREAARRTLVKQIGRRAVIPLCESLPHLDESNQRLVCGVLGEIGNPNAAPYLMDLARSAEAATVRDAANRAFRRAAAVNGDLSSAYARLAEKYFNESESLIAYPYDETNNVWSYDAFIGLEATPVPTAIFAEIMAMRTAARALQLNPSNDEALTLFVAANLRRENELPTGAADPIYGENPYGPGFYATVFGPRICQNVLSVAIDRLDTPLVRDAIAALAATTGGANLFEVANGRQPLLEALQYPDRRVQYEAALTLGRALPDHRFPGDVRVVPLLASAVRTGDESYAAVIAADAEDRRIRAEWLENLGFTIVAMGSRVDPMRLELLEAAGVDLVLVQVETAETAAFVVSELRVFPATQAAPIVVVAASQDMPRLRQEFRDDVRIKIARARAHEEGFGAAVDEVMVRAAGGRMTQAEAEGYAIDAIMTLRDIAISGSLAYAIADAEATLIQALETRTGGTRLAVADIMALVETPRSQRALFDAALTADGEEQIDLLDRVADSVRRFGDHGEPRQVEALVDLITNASGRTAEAAARVHGALNLPTGTAIRLIP